MTRKRTPPFLDNLSNLEAKFQAQKLAFGPLMFQAARCLREFGILAALKDRGIVGTTEDDLAESTGVSIYGLRVLLEAGLVGDMVAQVEDGWALTKVGYVMLADPMTRANMDFTHDVCYRPAFHLEAAIREGRPAGLKEFGDWATLYEGLSQLPPKARESWFAFDHYYSDGVFEELLPVVFASKPAKILDVGGNTGIFARLCCEHDPAVQVTIADLPGQLDEALANAAREGVGHRVLGHPCDLLDPATELPAGHDVIWMSQFLDCFSEDEIIQILRRAAAAMGSDTELYILETFWDQQKHAAARYSVVQTSLYFTVVANGNSKMYHSDRLRACVEAASMEVTSMTHDVGISHTLMKCRLARS
jgi:hypothetical protein